MKKSDNSIPQKTQSSDWCDSVQTQSKHDGPDVGSGHVPNHHEKFYAPDHIPTYPLPIPYPYPVPCASNGEGLGPNISTFSSGFVSMNPRPYTILTPGACPGINPSTYHSVYSNSYSNVYPNVYPNWYPGIYPSVYIPGNPTPRHHEIESLITPELNGSGSSSIYQLPIQDQHCQLRPTPHPESSALAQEMLAKPNLIFERKFRKSSKRTRSGCLTCRKRRIKCDERKPYCLNCQRSKKECLGYNPAIDIRKI